LLASLEERFTCEELDCFLGVGDNVLKEGNLVDKATGNIFLLFWEAMVLLAEEALSCFWK